MRRIIFALIFICACSNIFAQNSGGGLVKGTQWYKNSAGTILSNTNDNVGIGSSAPGRKLDVVGTVRATGFSGDGTNITGAATGFTSGSTNALKSATTTVNVSSATAPSNGQVLTATGDSAATWQAASGGLSGLTTNKLLKAASATTAADSVVSEQNSNIGIGTTGPRRSLETTGAIMAGDGTAAAPGFGFDDGAGMYQSAAGRVDFVRNSSTRVLSIDGNSNVGIGSVDPESILVVQGTLIQQKGGAAPSWPVGVATGGVRIFPNVANAGLVIGGSGGQIVLDVEGDGTSTYTNSSGTNNLRVNNATILALSSGGAAITGTLSATGVSTLTGNVGIGSAAPGSALDVGGNVGVNIGSISTPSLHLTAQRNTGVFFTPNGAGYDFNYSTNGFPIFKADLNSNMGIGTTSPLTKLAVNGNGVIGATYAGLKNTTANGLAVQSNVGIGTWAPTDLLEVQGAVRVTSTSSYVANKARLYNDAALGTVFSCQSGSGSCFYIVDEAGNEMITVPAGTAKILNLANVAGGNVGVGSATPGAKVDFQTGTAGFRVFGTVSKWTRKAAANTACDTTCGSSQCAFGEDTGNSLACSDATADVCICMGP